jgi:hypothetical protein
VYRLTAPLTVPDFHPYHRPPAERTLPAGTYWVPMAQSRKHWVQAMLNEDTYVPFPYFYDVTAFSQPLLFNVAGGWSGAPLTPRAERVPLLPAPPAPVPPAAPPPPPVGMAPALVEHAAAYRAYVRRASAMSPAFADGNAVEQSLAQAAAYEPKQLLAGQIAFGALLALQSPNFVAEVRTYAVDPSQRRDLAARLLREPSYAQALPSSAGAAGLVVNTLKSDADQVRRAGELVKQAAYDVQKQKWSLGPVPTPELRLAQAKTVSAQPVSANPDEVVRLSAAVQGGDAGKAAELGVSADLMSGPYTQVVSRSLALAALAALGEANDPVVLQTLLEEPSGAFCYNLSKLNLYQCLSVSRPYYEDVFCLGQHILLDTAQCLTKGAVIVPPEPAKVFPVVAPRPEPKPPARRTTTRRAPAKPAVKPAADAAAKPPVGAAASIKLKPAK